MTSRVPWFEPRQEQMNPYRRPKITEGDARGYDKEIRKKLDNTDNFIDESSALFMNAFPVTPREQTDAKIAIIETMLAQSDEHAATCNEIIKHEPCVCHEIENHIITRRNLKLLETVLLGIKKHIFNEPPNVLTNNHTYFDEANDITNRLARFRLTYHRPEHRKDCITFFRNKHPKTKTLKISFQDVRDSPTQITLTKCVLARYIQPFEEIHGTGAERDFFTDYVNDLKKQSKGNITRMHTSSKNPYERCKMVFLALSYFDKYKSKTFHSINGQTFQLKNVWTNEPRCDIENQSVSKALEQVFGLREESYKSKNTAEISLDIIENWQLAGAQIFAMYQLAIHYRTEFFLPNEEIKFPDFQTKECFEIDTQSHMWTILEKNMIMFNDNNLPTSLTQKTKLLADMENHHICKHITSEIKNKWRPYPITKITPRSLSNTYEMDHVINRKIAVALVTNIKEDLHWENIKWAYPFKTKCINRILNLLQNQGQM